MTGKIYKNILKKNVSPGYEKIISYEISTFKVFCNRVIGLGYPKFANGGMESRPYTEWILWQFLPHLVW